MPIVDRDKKRTVKGYLWCVRAILKPLVFFHYHDGSRAGKVALELFKDYKGALQVDGYAVYDTLDKLHDDGLLQMADVDPKKWMLYVLGHIHEYDNDYSRDIADFLPHNLKDKGLI